MGRVAAFSLKRNLLEVEHVKAHHTEKGQERDVAFEKFMTDGNEKADEFAEAGAMWDKGFMAQARAKTVQQERREVYAALCMQPAFTGWWNGKTAKNSSRSQKKGGPLWTRKERKQGIVRSGVPRPASTDV